MKTGRRRGGDNRTETLWDPDPDESSSKSLQRVQRKKIKPMFAMKLNGGQIYKRVTVETPHTDTRTNARRQGACFAACAALRRWHACQMPDIISMVPATGILKFWCRLVSVKHSFLFHIHLFLCRCSLPALSGLCIM